MKTYRAKIQGISPMSQSHVITGVPKCPSGERGWEWEQEHWRKRLTVDENGIVFVPPMALKGSLDNAASYLSVQVPGKGKQTFAKRFRSGVMVVDGMSLGIKAEDVGYEDLYVPSDGKKGGGSRVMKRFPVIPKWGGEFDIVVIDDDINQKVLMQHAVAAGQLIGLGMFRPQNGGYKGRFEVVSLKAVA